MSEGSRVRWEKEALGGILHSQGPHLVEQGDLGRQTGTGVGGGARIGHRSRHGESWAGRQSSTHAPAHGVWGAALLEHLECSWQPHIQGRGAKKHTQRAG